MYILNYKKDCIHNSADIQRFAISEKQNREGGTGKIWLICAAISTSEPMLTLGRYYSEECAKAVFMSLFTALVSDMAYFEMPLQSDLNEEERKRDARTKRKGGS